MNQLGPRSQYFFVLTVITNRYGRGMELRQLRYLVGVAEELNFTKASLKLHIAQPALSRQIRQLEEELGVTLLERNRRGVRLTIAGKAFLAEARALLQQSEKAVLAAKDNFREKCPRLNIGYIWGLFHSSVPALTGRFRQRQPDTTINLYDLTATQQAEALLDGTIDLGFIGFADEADQAGLAKKKIGASEFVAALPKNHRAARQRKIQLCQLAKEFFFLISEQNYPGAARFVSEACGRAGFRPRILQTAERGHTILGLVAGNCGVALLPEPLRALPHPGVVFRSLENPPKGELFVAWNESRPLPARDSFLEMIGEKERNLR